MEEFLIHAFMLEFLYYMRKPSLRTLMFNKKWYLIWACSWQLKSYRYLPQSYTTIDEFKCM